VEVNDAVVGYKIWGVDNVVYGPVELPVLVDWIREERVTADTWIFSERDESWGKAAQVQELQMFFRRRAAAAPASGGATEFSPLIPGVKPGALRRVKILAEMDDQQLGRFAQVMEVQNVRQWTEIVRQGAPGDAMYLVLEGEVRVRLMIGEKETILTTMSAGDFFGETSLFDQGPRSADVVANKDSVVLKISADNFQRLVRESPDLATPFLMAIARTLAARIRADNKRFRDQVAFARAAR
jgi:hypothetical protein